jgi:hypothetical protein
MVILVASLYKVFLNQNYISFIPASDISRNIPHQNSVTHGMLPYHDIMLTKVL